MNWVGGSRSRLVMRNDAKKQREFFERRRLEQKLKKRGISLPASTPTDTSSGSTDLMTLFIVNQIATKKENQDPPKVAVLGSCSGRSKRRRNEPLVLPMSPCSPSKLSFVESQSQFSDQGLRRRKNVIQQRFKCQQLSPVLESAFSDNSAPDYLPAITDPPSPTSSISSASSGRRLFQRQVNQSQTQAWALPHHSPPPWNNMGQQTKFQPFFPPRPMTDAVSWSCKSNSPLFRLETPTAAQTLFRSSEAEQDEKTYNYLLNKPEARDRGRDAANVFLQQSEDKDPLLDFTFNQPFDEGVFRVFGDEEGQREVSDCSFGNGKSKMPLTDESSLGCSTPQTVPDSPSLGAEFCRCSNMNSSCLRLNPGPVSGCESSPSCSCTAGYLSSDSNDDDEQCWEPCLQASYVDQACCPDNMNTNSQWDHQPSQSGSHTPQIMSTTASPYEAPPSQSQQTGRNKTVSSSSEPCRCRKVSTETQETASQTEHTWTPETCDASTQYSFSSDSDAKTSRFSFHQPDVDMSEQQTDAEPQTAPTSSKNSTSEVKQMLWSKKKSKAGSLSGSSFSHKFPASSSSKVIPQRPANPFVDFMSTRGKEKVRGQDEKSALMNEVPNEVKEVTFDSRTSVVSEEDKMLQEIADILLLLKQRKKEK